MIRPSTKEDFGQIFPLLEQLWTYLTLDYDVSYRAHIERRTIPNHFDFCFTSEGKIIAYATVSFRYSLWKCGMQAYIAEFVVDSNHRSKGIGRRLFDHICEFAKAHECKCVVLDSGLQRSEAHRFYERSGMEKDGFVFVMNLGSREEPNQALEPTATAVTDRAAHAPRQP